MAEAAIGEPVAGGDVDALRQLAAAVPNGVALVRDDRVVWANERLFEMAGRGSALLGEPLQALVTDAGGGPPRAGAGRAFECALIRPDGEQRTVVCRAASLQCTDGSSVAWVLEDVTHVRTLERELLRASQELGDRNREAASLRETLRTDNEELEEILTVVSHELRTPVTIIRGYSRLLLSEEVGPLNDQQRSFLSETAKSCQRLDAFIGNLLAASRESKGGEILEIRHAELAPVVEGLACSLHPLLEERRLEIAVDVTPRGLRARFDRLRLEQILTNLLGNAIRYSPVAGTIRVEARPIVESSAPEWVEVRVTDQGPGIAPEDRERVFDAYTRLGEESRAGGLGLGLAICRRLVRAHGGEIAVAEASDGGSAFSFTLPVSEETSSDSNRGES